MTFAAIISMDYLTKIKWLTLTSISHEGSQKVKIERTK